jgi:hypothetical protein
MIFVFLLATVVVIGGYRQERKERTKKEEEERLVQLKQTYKPDPKGFLGYYQITLPQNVESIQSVVWCSNRYIPHLGPFPESFTQTLDCKNHPLLRTVLYSSSSSSHENEDDGYDVFRKKTPDGNRIVSIQLEKSLLRLTPPSNGFDSYATGGNMGWESLRANIIILARLINPNGILEQIVRFDPNDQNLFPQDTTLLTYQIGTSTPSPLDIFEGDDNGKGVKGGKYGVFVITAGVGLCITLLTILLVVVRNHPGRLRQLWTALASLTTNRNDGRLSADMSYDWENANSDYLNGYLQDEEEEKDRKKRDLEILMQMGTGASPAFLLNM